MNEKGQLFEVRLRSKKVQRELDSLQETDYRRVLSKLKILGENPRLPGYEKLHGDICRVRVGNYRIIYLIDEKNKHIDIGAIRRRSEKTYKKINDLFN